MIGPDPYSFRELWRQYRRCRRNKRNTMNALAFEIDAEAHLLELQRELRDHTYVPGRSVCFVTDGPKPREVFAADFRDRIVHHLLVSWQEPLFERRFIHDSYACRKGKGTLAASDRERTNDQEHYRTFYRTLPKRNVSAWSAALPLCLGRVPFLEHARRR